MVGAPLTSSLTRSFILFLSFTAVWESTNPSPVHYLMLSSCLVTYIPLIHLHLLPQSVRIAGAPLTASLTRSFHLSQLFAALWVSANSSVIHSCCFPTSSPVFLLFCLLRLFHAMWSLRGQTSVTRRRL